MTFREMFSQRLRAAARFARRNLGVSPMQSVLRELARRGVPVSELHALECFAFDGHMHTVDYGRRVRALEAWEINTEHAAVLKRTFPAAVVRTVDTYRQIQECTERFDLIVVDNSPVHGNHIEHFDLFPGLFRVAAEKCVVVLDVITTFNAAVNRGYPEMYREDVESARRAFYGVANPRAISLDCMTRVYTAAAAAAGFTVLWSFGRKRNDIITYLVLALARVPETRIPDQVT